MTLITAHAGCDGTEPGSLQNLDAAVQHGADCVELDLRYYEGRVLLSHDPIERARLAGYVTLEEALSRLAESGVRINCDLKEEEAFPHVVHAFAKHGLTDRLDLTGCVPLRRETKESGYRVYVNLEHIPAEGLREKTAWFLKAREQDAAYAGVNIEYGLLDADTLALFHALAIPLMCWTVDDRREIDRLLDAGVYAITTNDVRYAAARV